MHAFKAVREPTSGMLGGGQLLDSSYGSHKPHQQVCWESLLLEQQMLW